MQINLVLNCILCVECLEALLRACIIDAQKLVLCRRHIDKIRFAFATFLIEKLIYRLIFRRFSQIGADDLVQCFSQMW